MDHDLLRDALTVVAGMFTGLLSGGFGVGGATVSTPALRLLGLPALMAVGTTLPSIFPSATAGTIRYARRHLVDWHVVLWTAPFGVLITVFSSQLSDDVPGDGHLLMVVTALLLGLTAARMARPEVIEIAPESEGGAAPSHHHAHRSKPVLITTGVLAGFLAGLLGVGGGIIMVPAFSEFVRMPLKRALGTSLVCVAILAIPSTIAHSIIGDIDWRAALLLCVGVIPGARIGSALTIRANERRLRATVSLFLGLIAVVYGITELMALAS